MGNEIHHRGDNYGIVSAGNKNKNTIDNRKNSESSEILLSLKELTKVVKESSHLDDKTKKEQIDIIKDMEKEASKPNPNKSKLQGLSSALVGALQTVPDVAKAVTALMSVLSQFHI